MLTTTALRSGQLLNATSFSRDLGVPLNTVRRHLGLLETTYQVWTVPPFHVNLGKRLVRTPKLYCTDTGLACSEDLKGKLGLAVILYSGQTTVVLNERVVAVPFGVFFAGQK